MTDGKRLRSTSGPVIGAVELSKALGLPFPPTDEQRSIIESPLEPSLVVAGAGAGKTETMAARVVWLVANRLVAPDAVLGLTFTRKAAQQLSLRIRQRLARLAGSGVARDLDPSGELAHQLAGAGPEVSTYHAYAGRLLTDYGLLLPVEPSVTLVTETQLWQLTHSVVSTWTDDVFTSHAQSSVTEYVMALSGQLAEHLVDISELRSVTEQFVNFAKSLPRGKGQKEAMSKNLQGLIDIQLERLSLLPLVARLREKLAQDSALDFGSQMSLAATLAYEHPEVGEGERHAFSAVLLDEYQDTGHAQRVLLTSLFGKGGRYTRSSFGETAVTAVGDPIQSIYGWRGASAANLPRFSSDFPRADGTAAQTRELLTSWRNPPQALTLANAVSADLRSRSVSVSTLCPRPGADDGEVRLGYWPTIKDERDWIAQQIATRYRSGIADRDHPPTAAVLIRRNSDAEGLANALTVRGIPVEIVGLGGLLHTPEVQDITAMLRMVIDPLAGVDAMRILTGPRWALGAKDLAALWQRSRDLVPRRRAVDGAVSTAEQLTAAIDDAVPADDAEDAGLGDAIVDPGEPHQYSVEGYRRIRNLSRELNYLRDRVGLPLTELVSEVERVLGIGIETQIRSTRLLGNSSDGQEQLNEFATVVANYSRQNNATVAGLLAYLDAAKDREDGLSPGEIPVAGDRVQILTLHAAKGLEWEIVALPHLVDKVFPSKRGSPTWLTTPYELPPPVRGDRAVHPSDEGVPALPLDAANRKEFETAIKDHTEALKELRNDEERRLLYVGLTRTENTLLISGHRWSDTLTQPREPSEFLIELKELIAAQPKSSALRIEHWADEDADEAENPYTDQAPPILWPRDPLGSHRESTRRGADAVLEAIDKRQASDSDQLCVPDDADIVLGDDSDQWSSEVDALLNEFSSRTGTTRNGITPTQLSASQLVEMHRDPEAFAQRLRRPLPLKPNPMTRRGTLFHAWLERRFGATRLIDVDDLPGATDADTSADDDVELLQRQFEASRWAHRTPTDVEVPFETSINGTIVRGRMDAVFGNEDDGWIVIDWKTGALPTESDRHSVEVQLAVYRIAWARLCNVPLDQVRAAFHYVRSNITVEPADLPDVDALERLLTRATGGAGDSVSVG